MAYEISDEDWEGGVRDQLDHREKGGYTQHSTLFYSQDSQTIPVTVYLGDTSHPQYAGPDSLDTMAETILTRVGPSGPNIEYLYNLCEAMRELVPQHSDPHLDQLEQRVRQLEAQQKIQKTL